jgi:GNAT superfamily N-acetyltransferase
MTAARPQVRIRKYCPADRGFLERGLNALLAEKARLAPTRDLVPSKRWGRPYAASLLLTAKKSRGVALLAEVNGVRAGFIFGAPYRVVPKWIFRSLAFSRPCSIVDLYVVPRFRKLGVAAHLMSEVENRFARRGYDWIVTAFHQGHQFEADLYERSGYAVNVVSVGKWLSGAGRARRTPFSKG